MQFRSGSKSGSLHEEVGDGKEIRNTEFTGVIRDWIEKKLTTGGGAKMRKENFFRYEKQKRQDQ